MQTCQLGLVADWSLLGTADFLLQLGKRRVVYLTSGSKQEAATLRKGVYSWEAGKLSMIYVIFVDKKTQFSSKF